MKAWIDENEPPKELFQTIIARIKSGKVYAARIEFPKGEVRVEDFKEYCKQNGIEITN